MGMRVANATHCRSIHVTFGSCARRTPRQKRINRPTCCETNGLQLVMRAHTRSHSHTSKYLWRIPFDPQRTLSAKHRHRWKVKRSLSAIYWTFERQSQNKIHLAHAASCGRQFFGVKNYNCNLHKCTLLGTGTKRRRFSYFFTFSRVFF